jgi:acetoin utilization deacetylase AcuC-like enzyme
MLLTSAGVLLTCAAGWCIFNDLAVAGKAAQRDAGIGQVLMLDLDVHQGDGSATIFAGK